MAKRILKVYFIVNEPDRKKPVQERGRLVDYLRLYAKQHKIQMGFQYVSLE